jgi:hypothetical protein
VGVTLQIHLGVQDSAEKVSCTKLSSHKSDLAALAALAEQFQAAGHPVVATLLALLDEGVDLCHTRLERLRGELGLRRGSAGVTRQRQLGYLRQLRVELLLFLLLEFLLLTPRVAALLCTTTTRGGGRLRASNPICTLLTTLWPRDCGVSTKASHTHTHTGTTAFSPGTSPPLYWQGETTGVAV